MRRAARRLARRGTHALDAFARHGSCVDAIASTSARAPTSTCRETVKSGAPTWCARSFASSGTPARANDEQREHVSASSRDARERTGKLSDSAHAKAEARDSRVEAFTTPTTAIPDNVINFRCLPVNKHLKDEVFGRTLRERWNSTYPNAEALKTFPSMYHYRLKVLSMYVKRCGGASFAAFAFVMLGTSWIVSSYVVALGMIGGLVMTKLVGLGDFGFHVIDLITVFYKYVAGDARETQELTLIFGTVLAYRMTYYTLPVTYFVYEELRFLVRRVVRLMRWVV